MSKRVRQVPVTLDDGNIKELSMKELRIILCGADKVVGKGGRAQLVKLLKGSKEKSILEHNLDSSPVYGALSMHSMPEISNMVDWAILNDYLEIEYDYRLPLLFFTNKGWEIEEETLVNEFFELFVKYSGSPISDDARNFVVSLKDKNRNMIIMLIQKIAKFGNKSMIPLLEVWKSNEYKKVASAINGAINKINER